MSKSLTDYGEQKSCTVTTAKRLANFLGDAIVKDKALHCQYIVACEPQGTPVSERAIPVAIFGTEAETQRFYVRKWCKVSSCVGIRSIVDWSYYKQRLSSAIQKIITIPAAMQKVSNPVPRVMHPEWLHKKVREKEDRFRQLKLVDFFSATRKISDDASVRDLEDILNSGDSFTSVPQPVVNTKVNKENLLVKQSLQVNGLNVSLEPLVELNHKDASGDSIDRNVDYQRWLAVKKRKWKATLEKRKRRRVGGMKESHQFAAATKLLFTSVSYKHSREKKRLNSFFRNHELALIKSHWQVIQLVPSTKPGRFLAWIVLDGVMLKINLDIPRIFYLNSKAPVTEEFPGRRVNKILPHSRPTFNLIEVIIDEEQFQTVSKNLASHLADPEVEYLSIHFKTKSFPPLFLRNNFGKLAKHLSLESPLQASNAFAKVE